MDIKHTRKIYFISGVPIPSLPLIGLELPIDEYYYVDRTMESVFKFLDSVENVTIVLDNLDRWIADDRFNSALFFEYLFESISTKRLDIIFLGRAVMSDLVNCDGNRKVRAKWQIWMLKYARNYGVSIRNIWLIRPSGFSVEKIWKTHVVLIQRVVFDSDKKIPRKVLNYYKFGKNSIEKQQLSQRKKQLIGVECELIDNIWTHRKKRYAYTSRKSYLDPSIKTKDMEYDKTIQQKRIVRGVGSEHKKALNVIKYACKQKSIDIDICDDNLNQRNKASINKLVLEFMDELVDDERLCQQIIDESVDAMWLIPFLSLFSYHWRRLEKENAADQFEYILKFPQIQNWLGNKDTQYFISFDAKKVVSLSRKLANSIQQMNSLFSIPQYLVDDFLSKKDECDLNIFRVAEFSFIELILPYVGLILSITTDDELSRLKGSGYSELSYKMKKEEFDYTIFDDNDKYQCKLIDIRAEGDYWTDTLDYRLSFNFVKIYVKERDLLIDIRINNDYQCHWELK